MSTGHLTVTPTWYPNAVCVLRNTHLFCHYALKSQNTYTFIHNYLHLKNIHYWCQFKNISHTSKGTKQYTESLNTSAAWTESPWRFVPHIWYECHWQVLLSLQQQVKVQWKYTIYDIKKLGTVLHWWIICLVQCLYNTVMNNRTPVTILHIITSHTHKRQTSTAAYATGYTTLS